MGPFPVVKLGSILVKQISKPLVNLLIERAKTSPVFRTYICMPPAQFFNWCEVKIKMWVLNLGKPVSIPVLNEAMAIELGANLIGETIIYSIAAGAVVFEMNRSSRRESQKEANRVGEIESLNNQIQELYLQTQQQEVQIKELLRAVYALHGKEVKDSNNSVSKPNNTKPKPPPPTGLMPKVVSVPVAINDDKIQHPNNKIIQNESLIVTSGFSIVNDFFANSNTQREQGILIVALNYLCKDVYKIPLKMY